MVVKLLQLEISNSSGINNFFLNIKVCEENGLSLV